MSDRSRYPSELGPPAKEKVTLPSVDRPLLLTKFTPRFERWSEELHGPKPTRVNERGETVPDDWNGKPFLWVGGEPKFAELAIVHAFRKEGWEGVWVHSPGTGGYTNDYPVSRGRVEELPDLAAAVMSEFTAIAGGAGCRTSSCGGTIGSCSWSPSRKRRRTSRARRLG